LTLETSAGDVPWLTDSYLLESSTTVPFRGCALNSRQERERGTWGGGTHEDAVVVLISLVLNLYNTGRGEGRDRDENRGERGDGH
ncbi:unnamed protein product, partial [Ectocarpus sp. 6 AP-2014]